jgi:glucosyl-dolichyl phosphate glucuronosyltransferase
MISICICTYNRSNVLIHCLRSLSQLTDPRPQHEVEVIVIDNNSNDDTSVRVSELIPSFPFEMRYVFEGRQGLSAARNRAVEEAKGEYLAFLDDECIVGPDWLSIALLGIEGFRPSFIGGPYIGAFFPGNRPRWFKIEYGNAYFLKYGFKRGLQDQFRASGGNMFVRRDVFEEHRFDLTLGMIGRRLKIGEETDLQERFLRSHNSEGIFYEPALVVHHFILPRKMQLSYRAELIFSAAFGSPDNVSLQRVLIALCKIMIFAIISPIRCILRDREKYPYWQNDIYERAIPQTCFHGGTVAKYLRDRWTRANARRTWKT